ncbi:MAG: DUF1028 domain-containing protein [Planctomycetota bacterium]|jgi:uncharacterized Ntn-hydrolase superfamily protein
MKRLIVLSVMLLSVLTNARMLRGEPLTHTFSIVAYDQQSGQIGVAVQSHWFSVGSIVSWAEAGVGAVATQSLVNVSFGPRALESLKKGYSPQKTVEELINADEGRDFRQLAVIDKKGRVATHTGEKCIADAGHIIGKNYSVQANMMLNKEVVPAMSKAFEQSSGPLAERMVAALQAAQKAGGDIRGQQSAAIIIVRVKSTGKFWEDRLIDLRVEDHPNAVKELARILAVFRAYEHMNKGDLAIEKGDEKTALQEYAAAEKMFPNNTEMKFWHAVALVNIGKVDLALPIFKKIFAKDKNYIELTRRIVSNGLLKADEATLQNITTIH